MAGYVADEDATVVARLRQAGAICLGKLNTYEFASGSMEAFGSARNPWNTLLTPSGSSAGSGAALAAHLVTLASGTDTGGSIRHPAAFCGVVGLKPTYGRVSRAGILALSWSMDHAGPLARTVADTALFLQAIAGPDPRDPTAAQQPVPNYHAALGGGVHRVRIGVPRTFFFEQAEPEVADAGARRRPPGWPNLCHTSRCRADRRLRGADQGLPCRSAALPGRGGRATNAPRAVASATIDLGASLTPAPALLRLVRYRAAVTEGGSSCWFGRCG
jgi:hypothetical protein